MSALLLSILVGRLLIYAIQKFPFTKLPFLGSLFHEGKFLGELIRCDFCLGVWIFSFFSWLFKINLFYEYFYIFVLSEFLTGLVASFLVHIFVLGLKAKFETIIVE